MSPRAIPQHTIYPPTLTFLSRSGENLRPARGHDVPWRDLHEEIKRNNQLNRSTSLEEKCLFDGFDFAMEIDVATVEALVFGGDKKSGMSLPRQLSALMRRRDMADRDRIRRRDVEEQKRAAQRDASRRAAKLRRKAEAKTNQKTQTTAQEDYAQLRAVQIDGYPMETAVFDSNFLRRKTEDGVALHFAEQGTVDYDHFRSREDCTLLYAGHLIAIKTPDDESRWVAAAWLLPKGCLPPDDVFPLNFVKRVVQFLELIRGYKKRIDLLDLKFTSGRKDIERGAVDKVKDIAHVDMILSQLGAGKCSKECAVKLCEQITEARDFLLSHCPFE